MIDSFMIIVAMWVIYTLVVAAAAVLVGSWALTAWRDHWRRARAVIEVTVDEHAAQAAAVVEECTWCDPKVRDGLCSCDISCHRYLCKGPVPLGTWNDHDIEVIKGRRGL